LSAYCRVLPPFTLKNVFLDGYERFAFNALHSVYARLGLVDDVEHHAWSACWCRAGAVASFSTQR
jgi:hypothetical protein